MPALGCICCSLEHEGRQLLGLRRGPDAYAEAGSTTGIPLLHPWANRIAQPRYRAAGREVAFDAGLPALHLDGNGLPIHGVLGRELPFRVAGVGATWLDAALESGECPGLTAVFPYTHRLRVEARLEP